MKNLKFCIVGSGGRESAFAQKLCEDTELYAVIDHKNPMIINCVEKTGGQYTVGKSSAPKTVLDFVIKHSVDYVFVSADTPLANGVVDILLANNIKAIGGTKAATRIEWDKIYSIDMMKKVGPEYTPFYKVISNKDELVASIEEFKNSNFEVVVKPQGLTGGKGVKVMPEHLPDYQSCINYASQLLTEHPEEQVLLMEKIEGIEFTIMGITDGDNLVLSPASYDYPFRFEGDKGAGTGGMGCYTNTDKKLPFMSDKDLSDCRIIMERIIAEMKKENLFFNGVLNGGFFKTKEGIKFMEFNGRFGDPEGLNILSVLKGSFSKVLIHIWNKTLKEDVLSFRKKASVIKYMVAKEYPLPSNEVISFEMNEKAIEQMGVSIFFAFCEKHTQSSYITLKKSRVVAFGALADTVKEASELVNEAIEKHFKGDLEYRADIGLI